MSWDRWRAVNLANWEERVAIHVGPDGYDIDGLLSDPARLSRTVRNDLPLLKSVAGLDVAHLQCHIGTDTLSLARLGARSVAGIDFSPKAIAQCRKLFERAGMRGRFEIGDVHDAADHLGDAAYDFVYASIGAINWIPSIARWMAVAARLLRPGGRLYLRDAHPMAMVVDPDSTDEIRLHYAYGETREPVTLQDEQTYAGDGTPLANTTTHEWSHGLGEIVQAALDAGLVITGLHEHFYIEWPMFPAMVSVEPGRYVLPDRPERLPLLFTLTASKPG